MIADISIREKSFGPKVLMTGVKFGVDDGEKVGVVGRNGVGKSTLKRKSGNMFKYITGNQKIRLRRHFRWNISDIEPWRLMIERVGVCKVLLKCASIAFPVTHADT